LAQLRIELLASHRVEATAPSASLSRDQVEAGL
jgi:hypothetical protein